ncbi:uncharacterized protein LOC112013411 [Quercus suber]|uniref:uncharacterized protein LOC112013411 n=1 Tax=Quercus suber TaxID=58331 RepID=UPI000CE1B2CC|nr:uncharacterized protein LOC112013411 [Quercus suber]
MSKALRQISKSPFTRRIDKAKLPHRFAQPTFTIYNGRTNSVERVSHFNQRMAIHSRNETLMCKFFPSSLRLVAMRWFDELEEGSIRSLEELTRAFGETFNEIGGDFEDVAIRTFKIGLPTEHDLRKSLTKKLARSMCQLMDRIDKHKRVEEDQTQGKGKVKVFPEKRDLLAGGYNHNQPMRDFSNQSLGTGAQMVNSVFK